MASIPLVSERSAVAQRGPLALRNPDIPAGAVGAASAVAITNAGNQLQQTGNQFYEAGQKLQREDDQREHSKLDTELAAYIGQIGYGTGEGEDTGFYGKQGENAINGYKEADAAIRAKASELASNASNERVRQMFNVSSGARLTQEGTRYLSHVSTERKKANIAVADAAISQATNDAVAAYNDRGVLQRSLTIADIQVEKIAEQSGASDKVKEEMLLDTHSGIIKAAFDMAVKREDNVTASRILKENSDSINAKHKIEMTGALESANNLAASQAATDKIMAGSGTLSERLEQARMIKDPKVRQAVEAAVVTRTNQELQSINIQTNEIGKRWAGEINSGKTVEELSLANPDEYALIKSDLTLNNQLRAAQNAFAANRIFAPTSDGVTMASFRANDQETIAKMTQEQIERYRPQMTKVEYGQALSIWSAARKSVEAKGQSSATYAQADTILNRIAPAELEFNSRNPDASVKAQQNSVRNQLYGWIDQEISKGKVPTHAEIVQEVNRMFLPVRGGSPVLNKIPILGWFIDNPATLQYQLKQLKPDQQKTYKIDIDNVTQEAKNEATSKLKALGVTTVTDDLLADFFGAEAVGDTDRQIKLINDAIKTQR